MDARVWVGSAQNSDKPGDIGTIRSDCPNCPSSHICLSDMRLGHGCGLSSESLLWGSASNGGLWRMHGRPHGVDKLVEEVARVVRPW